MIIGLKKIKIVKITYLYFAALILLTLVLIFVTPLLYKLIGDQYSAGQRLSTYIMIAYLFNGMYKMFGNYLFYLKKTKIIALGTLVTLIFNLILNYYLIPTLGVSGAAISLIISFLIQFLAFVIIAQYHYRMPWISFKKSF